MIPFILTLASNALWIVGLALLLAALSYHTDRARQAQISLARALDQRSFLIPAWLGLALVGMGLAATSERGWETALWLVLALLALAQSVSCWRKDAESYGN